MLVPLTNINETFMQPREQTYFQPWYKVVHVSWPLHHPSLESKLCITFGRDSPCFQVDMYKINKQLYYIYIFTYIILYISYKIYNFIIFHHIFMSNAVQTDLIDPSIRVHTIDVSSSLPSASQTLTTRKYGGLYSFQTRLNETSWSCRSLWPWKFRNGM